MISEQKLTNDEIQQKEQLLHIDEEHQKELLNLEQKKHSLIIQDKIYDNTYESCCIRVDKRALTYLIQVFFCFIVLIFCVIQMSLYDDCATYAKYSSIMMFIIGVFIPNPSMKS